MWGPSRKKTQKILIADSREGWVDSVRYLINAYFSQMPAPEFDYSIIRPAGLPIKGFGGISQGGEILKELHEQIEKVRERRKSCPNCMLLSCDVTDGSFSLAPII